MREEFKRKERKEERRKGLVVSYFNKSLYPLRVLCDSVVSLMFE